MPTPDSSRVCEYARSDMTPCVERDGALARASDGACVGCDHGVRLPPDRQLMQCRQCGKLQTYGDARYRKFNEGRCSCGGALIPRVNMDILDPGLIADLLQAVVDRLERHDSGPKAGRLELVDRCLSKIRLLRNPTG